MEIRKNGQLMISDKESPQDGCALTALSESFICPNCSKAIQIPYEVKGSWQVFPAKVSCSECKKDISRPIFEALLLKGLKFKRSRFVGRTATEAGSPENPVVETGVLTFEEACRRLKPKEQMFLLEYVKDFNAARAATMAGYSRHRARRTGYDLVTKRDIQIAFTAFFSERRKKAIKTVDDIQRELEKVGFTDITDVISFTREGLTFIKDSDEISEDARAALESVEFSENLSGINVKVKMRDKIAALKLLGLQLGMFRQKVDVTEKRETYEQWRIRVGIDKE